jgi:hypothetical protein
MTKTKNVVATTENAPIVEISQAVMELKALPDFGSDLIVRSLRHQTEGAQLEGDFVAWCFEEGIPNTHFISPNITNSNKTKKSYLNSTATPEFYDDCIKKARLGKFGELGAHCLSLENAEQVRYHPDFADTELGGDHWASWYTVNNKAASGIVGDWRAKLIRKEEGEAKKKAYKAEIALAEKEGRKPDLTQFDNKKGADQNKPKTPGQKFSVHLDNALKSLATWKNMDTVPDTILDVAEQYAKDIKAMMAKAKKAEEVRH